MQQEKDKGKASDARPPVPPEFLEDLSEEELRSFCFLRCCCAVSRHRTDLNTSAAVAVLVLVGEVAVAILVVLALAAVVDPHETHGAVVWAVGLIGVPRSARALLDKTCHEGCVFELVEGSDFGGGSEGERGNAEGGESDDEGLEGVHDDWLVCLLVCLLILICSGQLN